MSISPNINDKQNESLVEYPSSSGLVVRRVYVANGIDDPIPLSPSGLNTGGRVSEVSIDSTSWTALPATALTNRNALSIQNRSGIEVKINYDNSTVGYVGIVIPNGGERFYDITDSIVIYAKSASGTPTLNIEEIA